jgi:hypothetical protein
VQETSPSSYKDNKIALLLVFDGVEQTYVGGFEFRAGRGCVVAVLFVSLLEFHLQIYLIK